MCKNMCAVFKKTERLVLCSSVKRMHCSLLLCVRRIESGDSGEASSLNKLIDQKAKTLEAVTEKRAVG